MRYTVLLLLALAACSSNSSDTNTSSTGSEGDVGQTDAREGQTASNSATSNGTASNGTASNGTTSNGATSNGTASNGATSNGTASNGATSNGTASNGEREPVHVRFATFNVALSDFQQPGELEAALEAGAPRAAQIAEIIQRARPDVLLLNEFDRDTSGAALRLFLSNYLEVSQAGQDPIRYPHTYTPDCNTGRLSEADLDGNGEVTRPNDAYGFGRYDGQYCMAIVSLHPIQVDGVRTLQKLLWKAMPDNQLPTDYYSAAAQDVFRISSKTHADVPIDVEGRTVHFLVSHPTPPVFDGPEDRNGRRNFDEIRLWADYLTPDRGGYITDDGGAAGGLAADVHFVIAGDQNADPAKGDSVTGAIQQLLEHPRVNATMAPTNGAGSTDTSSFNLRVDYVLPSTDLGLKSAGMFSPASDDPLAELARVSDHRLVWVDVEVP